MYLITRLIIFLVSAFFNLLWFVLALLLQFLLLPSFLVILRIIGGLVFFSFTATVSGPRQFIDLHAGEWTERIHEGTTDRSHLYEVFQLCRVLVGAIIVLGWLVAGFFTFSILRIVFGFFT